VLLTIGWPSFVYFAAYQPPTLAVGISKSSASPPGIKRWPKNEAPTSHRNGCYQRLIFSLFIFCFLGLIVSVPLLLPQSTKRIHSASNPHRSSILPNSIGTGLPAGNQTTDDTGFLLSSKAYSSMLELTDNFVLVCMTQDVQLLLCPGPSCIYVSISKNLQLGSRGFSKFQAKFYP